MSPDLPSDLVERVLTRLDHREPPPVTLDGLTALYRAWCRAVPFDNVQLMLRIQDGSDGTLAGWPASSFFAEWLSDGTGGVCMPTAWAWHSLLGACGFRSGCAVAGLNGRQPNHLTAVVDLDGTDYVVDTAYLSEVPVPLRSGGTGTYGTGLHEVRVRADGDSWLMTYRAPAHGGEHPCLLLHRDASPRLVLRLSRVAPTSQQFQRFSTVLFCRRNTPHGHLVVVGSRVIRARHGVGISHSLNEDLGDVLRAEMGYSAEVVRRLTGGVSSSGSSRSA